MEDNLNQVDVCQLNSEEKDDLIDLLLKHLKVCLIKRTKYAHGEPPETILSLESLNK